MQKTLLYGTLAVLVLVGTFFVFNTYLYKEKQAYAGVDHKNAEYVVDGARVRLTDGISEVSAAPGSASTITTRYFGNELWKDLSGDGRDDVVFLLTQEGGGSGVFFYVVAALATDAGYVGSEGLLLGDRIAPQTTESGTGKIVLVNYADRAPGDPFTVSPSIGKSIWLLLDPETMQFGEVARDFEGEADPSVMTLSMTTWRWVEVLMSDGKKIQPKKFGTFTLTFSPDGTFSATTDCNSMSGSYTATKDALSFGPIASTKMYCEGSQEADFAKFLEQAAKYHLTSKGEFIIDLKLDSGSVVFK